MTKKIIKIYNLKLKKILSYFFLCIVFGLLVFSIKSAFAVGTDYTWVGGVSSSWSDPLNWAPNGIPGTDVLDTVTFDTNQVDCNIDRNISVAGITLTSNYTRTLTQTSTYTITIGANGYSQAGGTFQGGSGAITNTTDFTLSNGAFNSTTDVYTINGNWTHTAGGTFNHNGGSVNIRVASMSTKSIDVINEEIFNNLILSNNGPAPTVLNISAGDTLTVLNTYTISLRTVNTGIINAQGDVAISASTAGGSAILQFTGPNNQTYTDSGGTKTTGAVTVNKTAGALTLASNLNYSAAGQTFTLENGTINQGSYTMTFRSYVQSGGVFNGGSGAITINHDSYYSASMFNLSGGTFNSTSGVLTFNASSSVNVDNEPFWNHILGGVFNHNNGTVTVASGYRVNATININSTEMFNNFEINMYITSIAVVVPTGKTIIIQGKLTFTKGYISNGTVDVRGDVYLTSNAGYYSALNNSRNGGATLLFSMPYDQKITAISSGGYIPKVNINKITGNVEVVSNGNDVGIDRITITNGVFISTNQTLNIGSSWTHISTNGVFQHNNGTVSFTNVTNYDSGGIFLDSLENFNNLIIGHADAHGGFSITPSKNVVVKGDFTHADTMAPNGGNIQIYGNASIGATAGGGTTALQFTGSNNQTYTDLGGIKTTGTVTVNKTGGVLSLASAMTYNAAGQAFNLTSGTLDMNGNNLSVTNLTVGSAGVLKNTGATGTLTVGGPVVNNGNVQMRTSAGCGGADTVAIQSSVAGTQRLWSGTGTTNFSDITVQDQGGTQAITAYSSTSTSGNGANWTFSGSCPLMMVTPNGGEKYSAKTSQTVSYTTFAGTDHYRVLLSTDSGATYPNLLGTTADTSYSWTTPTGNRANCRIKVQAEDAGNNVLSSAESASDFLIQAVENTIFNGGVILNGGVKF